MVWLAGSPIPNHLTAKKFPIVCYFLRQGRLRETKWVERVCVCVHARSFVCVCTRVCVRLCVHMHAHITKSHYTWISNLQICLLSWNLFVIPKSILVKLLYSFVDYRMYQKFGVDVTTHFPSWGQMWWHYAFLFQFSYCKQNFFAVCATFFTFVLFIWSFGCLKMVPSIVPSAI